MNALRTHQPAANCAFCGNGEPLPGATCAFEELCPTCQEGRCMDCGDDLDTDSALCRRCGERTWVARVSRRSEGGVR